MSQTETNLDAIALANELLDESRVLFDKRKFSEAFVLLSRLHDDFPVRSDVMYMLGKVLYEFGDYGNARNFLMKCNELEPGEVNYIAALGMCYLRQGFSDNSYKCFEIACNLPESKPKEFAIKIHCELDVGDFEAAIKTCNQAFLRFWEAIRVNDDMELAVNRGDFDLINIAARLALHFEDVPRSESLFKFVLDRQPNNVDALVGYGSLLFQCGFYCESEVFLRRALKVDSVNFPALAVISELYLRMGKDREASSSILLAETLYSGNLGVVILKARLLDFSGNRQDAISFLRKRLRKSLETGECESDEFDRGLYFLSELLWRHGEYSMALAFLEKKAEIKDPLLRLQWKQLMSALLLYVGRFDEALDVLNQAYKSSEFPAALVDLSVDRDIHLVVRDVGRSISVIPVLEHIDWDMLNIVVHCASPYVAFFERFSFFKCVVGYDLGECPLGLDECKVLVFDDLPSVDVRSLLGLESISPSVLRDFLVPDQASDILIWVDDPLLPGITEIVNSLGNNVCIVNCIGSELDKVPDGVTLLTLADFSEAIDLVFQHRVIIAQEGAFANLAAVLGAKVVLLKKQDFSFPWDLPKEYRPFSDNVEVLFQDSGGCWQTSLQRLSDL